jgi:hypothetical protein
MGKSVRRPKPYPQELQEPFEQDDLLHEDDPAKGLSTPLMPKAENFLVTSEELHFGQIISWEEFITSFSNSSPQEHLYS